MSGSSILVASVLAAGLAWATYFCFKDRCEPEFRRPLAVVFAVGALSTGPAWMLYRLVEWLGLGYGIADDPNASAAVRLLYFVLVVGAIEEGCKFLSVRWFLSWLPENREPLQILIFATVGGLGFASVENVVLGGFLQGPELWGRIVASPLTHALFAAVWGYPLALDLSTPSRHSYRLAIGLAGAFFLHGLYDFFVLSPGLGGPAAAGLVLGLWVAFFVGVARMLRRRRHSSGAHERADGSR